MGKPEWAEIASKRMKALGLKQGDLLEVFDVTTSSAVNHYFSGRRKVPHKGFVRLSEKLGMRLQDLLGSEYGVEHIVPNCSDSIVDAARILVKQTDAPQRAVDSFFSVLSCIGTDNLLRVANEISNANDEDRSEVLLQIQRSFEGQHFPYVRK